MNLNAAGQPSESVPWLSVPTHALPSRLRIVLGVLAVATLVVQHGFEHAAPIMRGFGWIGVLLGTGFALDLGLSLRPARRRQAVWRARRFEFRLLGTVGLLFLTLLVMPSASRESLLRILHVPSGADLAFILVELFLVANVGLQIARLVQLLFAQGIRPEVVLAGSFAGLILTGTLLLLLPRAGASAQQPIGLMDALFTATSASCVTGLVVRDTGTAFSTLGQMTILALFQIGGLGIITFVAVISAFSERSLPLPQMAAFRQVINAPDLSGLRRRFIGIILVTLTVEFLGTMALFAFAPGTEDVLARIKWALFHAVSAFCNAGFALQADSLESFRHHLPVNLTVMILIVLGGIGFLVIPELGTACSRFPGFPFRTAASRRNRAPLVPRLSVQTRLSLLVTLAMIATGFAGFWLLEAGHALNDRGVGQGWLAALFQSVTARTAGFNTIPVGELRQATLVLLMMLMVVGASPVSAGGGIKTVTFGILLLAIRSMLLRRDKVEAFGRTLPQRAVYAALSVFVLYMMTAAIGVFLLTWFDPEMALRDLLFETVSALSTVGLGTGITANLSPASQLTLCLLMFIGRVGPISLVLSIFHARPRLDYDFPAEDVIVS